MTGKSEFLYVNVIFHIDLGTEHNIAWPERIRRGALKLQRSNTNKRLRGISSMGSKEGMAGDTAHDQL